MTTDFIKLSNGDLLYKWYGKYAPNFCLLTKQELKPYYLRKQVKASDFNLPDNDRLLYMIPGKYWVSQKGTKCFRADENGAYILLIDEWGGGCFRTSKARRLPEESEGAVYFRRARSNGGGCGTDYAVVPKGWVNHADEYQEGLAHSKEIEPLEGVEL